VILPAGHILGARLPAAFAIGKFELAVAGIIVVISPAPTVREVSTYGGKAALSPNEASAGATLPLWAVTDQIRGAWAATCYWEWSG
jgi:hypothetical protein